MTSPALLARVRELLKLVTPGEWRAVLAKNKVYHLIDYEGSTTGFIAKVHQWSQPGFGPEPATAENNAELLALVKPIAAALIAMAEENERLREALVAEIAERIGDALPSTAENPNEDAYQRGRFDGVMEYGTRIAAILAALASTTENENG